MSAKRLPGKPLLKINNLPMITHVVNRAKNTNLGRVVVCTEDQIIYDNVKQNGGEAILTHKKHKTGTDRIFEGFKKLDCKDVEYIINLQGDEPALNENDIINLNNFMIKHNSDIGTLAAEIKEDRILSDENVVKVISKEKLNYENFPEALNFTRKVLSKIERNIYHHIGIYAYKAEILEKFFYLKQTQSEKENRLEQLRALDNSLNINIALAKTSPIGVDTEEEYLAIKKIMEYKS